MSSDSPKAECTPTQPKPTNPNLDAQKLEAAKTQRDSHKEQSDFADNQYRTLWKSENRPLELLHILTERLDRHRQLHEQSEKEVKKLEEAASQRKE